VRGIKQAVLVLPCPTLLTVASDSPAAVSTSPASFAESASLVSLRGRKCDRQQAREAQ
jgi:hypothetical protein